MFDITSVIADSTDTIIRLGWTYTTADGSLGGTHELQLPAGTEPIDKVTKAELIGWLKDQLGNTEDELAEGIKRNAAAAAEAAAEREVPVPA